MERRRRAVPGKGNATFTTGHEFGLFEAISETKCKRIDPGKSDAWTGDLVGDDIKWSDGDQWKRVGRRSFQEEYELAKKNKYTCAKYWNYVKKMIEQRNYTWLEDIVGNRTECYGSSGWGHYWGVIKEIDFKNGDFVLIKDKSDPGKNHGHHWRKGEKDTDRGDYVGVTKAIRLCWLEGETKADSMMRRLKLAVEDKKLKKIDAEEFNRRKLWILFDKIDADGSGDLTKEELEEALKRGQITEKQKEQILQADTDKDGVISAAEFTKFNTGALKSES